MMTLADRRRYLNSCDALQHLIDWRVIPVINENDTVSTDEIRFGDNDTLAADGGGSGSCRPFGDPNGPRRHV